MSTGGMDIDHQADTLPTARGGPVGWPRPPVAAGGGSEVTFGNAAFVLSLLAATSLLVWNDPAVRAGRARRREQRLARRVEVRAQDQARQCDLDAIYRNYRAQVRLYQAGHHPALAGPTRLPGDPAAGPVGPDIPSARPRRV